jgi:uncharacterized protein (TIGR03067 family)
MRRASLVLMASLAAVAADVPGGGLSQVDASGHDLGRLQGEWQVQRWAWKGHDLPTPAGAGIWLRGAAVALLGGGGPKVLGSVRLNAEATPPAVDFLVGNPAEVCLGIYQLDGDTVTVCFTAPGNGRPQEFTLRDPKVMLVVFKRAKK